MREDQVEAKNTTLYTFVPQRNNSDNIINKVANLTINDIRNNIINKVANFKINNIVNNLINKVSNLTINDVVNDSNRATAGDVQVQFSGDLAGIYHQNLLSIREIGIRHKEVHVLNPHTEPSID